jgi:hypothetical protein
MSSHAIGQSFNSWPEDPTTNEEFVSTADRDAAKSLGDPLVAAAFEASGSRDVVHAAGASGPDVAGPSVERVRAARYLEWGLLILGSLAGLERLASLAPAGAASSREWIIAMTTALYVTLAHGLAGFVGGAWLRTWNLPRVRYQAIGSMEPPVSRKPFSVVEMVPPAPLRAASPEPIDDRPARSETLARAASEIRRWIGEKDWTAASSALEALALEFDDPALVDRLTNELKTARQEAIESELSRLEASREAGDVDGVFERFRNASEWLDGEHRRSIEQDLARWFMATIQRRLLTGKIQPEVVELATRVASVFDTTREGASLRASLPTLRRSVGLCPRCARPYQGVASACPECLGTVVDVAAHEPEIEPDVSNTEEAETPQHDSESPFDR